MTRSASQHLVWARAAPTPIRMRPGLLLVGEPAAIIKPIRRVVLDERREPQSADLRRRLLAMVIHREDAGAQ